MQFSPSFIEQLRSRIILSEIVGKQVRLVHKHGGSYTGLCPFHHEKTPSFTVSNEKGFYHCFGCSAHGDAINFVMAKEGLAFTQAVSYLAEQAGIPLPIMEQPGKEAEERYKKAQSAYEVMELACRWFEQQLMLYPGKEALEYCMERGLTREAIAKFRIGFAPDGRQALSHYLKAEGVSEQLLLDVGLTGKSDKGETYDRFRGRIIFPIMDGKTRVIAFGGRIIREGQPKYLNSPETMLFKKGEVLYAEHLARKPAYEQGRIVAVEGYMDVIALHMGGIEVAVAPLGTALTEQHIKRLWGYAKEPVICLDGDSAGKRAMARIAMHSLPLLKPGFSLKFAQLPKGQDPDEALKKYGKAFMDRLLSTALPLSAMLWENAYSQKKLTTPEQKAAFEHMVMQYAAAITDTQVQGYYRRYFASKIWELIKRAPLPKQEKNATQRLNPLTMLENQSSIERCQYTLMAIIVRYGELLTIREVETAFINIDFTRSDLDKLRTAILDLRSAKSALDAEDNTIKDFRALLEKSGFGDNIQYLYGNSSFLGNIAVHTNEDALLLWSYALDKYHLSLMQEEHKAALSEMTLDAEKKALEYYGQIRVLEKRISEKEQILLNND